MIGKNFKTNSKQNVKNISNKIANIYKPVNFTTNYMSIYKPDSFVNNI